jgi:hypothetical protein
MKRAWIALIIIACPLLGWAQQQPPGQFTPPYGTQPPPYSSNPNTRQATPTPYQPAVAPAPTMYGGGGGWGGGYGGGAGSTVAGSQMTGMANVISSSGQAALNRSAAAVNLTQADAQHIVNEQAATDAYFNMRATNRAAVAAENGPRLTLEQMTQIAKEGVPNPLSREQYNPVSGKLNWPSFLQQPPFDTRRNEVDGLMAKQAEYGSLPYGDQTKVRSTIESMFTDLKAQIDSIPTPDYLASRTFLNNLKFAATRTQL